MTKKEKAFHLTLSSWDKFLLAAQRRHSSNLNFYMEVDDIIQSGRFQKFYVTVENYDNNAPKQIYCHFVFDRCNGISGYFDGVSFYEKLPSYYNS